MTQKSDEEIIREALDWIGCLDSRSLTPAEQARDRALEALERLCRRELKLTRLEALGAINSDLED